jgi:hypothetical protein
VINELIINTVKPLVPIYYQKYLGTASTYATFFYYLIQPEDSSDDERESTGYYIQIDLYYNGDIGDLAEQIGNILETKDFRISEIRDLNYDDVAKKYHTAITIFYLEENI